MDLMRAWSDLPICVGVLVAVMAMTVWGPHAQAQAPPLEEGPLVVRAINGGRLAERYLWQADRDDQKVALWIPDGVETIRGVYLHLHTSSEAYRTDLQEFARANDLAVFATLIRWADFENVLPAQLAGLGEALGHDYLDNVPWAALGGSRNVSALANYTMRDPNPHRILALLFNGGPGVGMDLRVPERLETFSRIPIMTVNGSADPFVDGMAWQERVYPQIRSRRMPWGVAVAWGGGHHGTTHSAMYFPFVQAAFDARYPADADPRSGRVELTPMTHDQGWLIGPVDWTDTAPLQARPVAQYEGDPAKAVWLPDERTVAVWRAYNQPDPPAVLVATPFTVDGREMFALSLAGLEDPAAEVEFFDADRRLPSSDRQALVAAEGMRYVYAAVTDASGRTRYTRPVVLAGAKVVDQLAGDQAAFDADRPANVIELPDDARSTLQALLARREADVPSEWKLAFADDFSAGELSGVWYEYYTRSHQEGRGRPSGNRMEVVDGALQLTGEPHQAVAMLPWDWPDEVAVEYRARAMGQRHCDLSVVLSGNPSGSAFPWRGGMMFQFGAHWNQGSFFLIQEQPDRDWKAHDTGARVEPGTWHHVRVERVDGATRAFVDGQRVAEKALSGEQFERFFGRRIGLYTFGSTAQFDDVRIYVRAASDPAALPPLPSPGDLDALAMALAGQMASRYRQQRGAAGRLLADLATDLNPAIARIVDRVGDQHVRQTLRNRLAAHPPAPAE